MILSTKIQLFSLACAIGLVYWFIQSSSAIPSVQWNTECDATTTATHKSNSIVPFIDLNQNNTAPQTNSTYKDHILILTPFKQSAQFIDQFFDNVNRLTYPHNLISLGFLVSDSTDGTIEKLRDKAAQANRLDEWRRFEKISIFQKDYKFELASNEDRHAFEVQVKRRNIMAKSRNTLLSSALTELHDWVLWLDSDVVDYPETILEELIGIDKDIIVPNCYWHSYNEEGGYDKNNWQETDESWDFQKSLSPEDVLVEGTSNDIYDVTIILKIIVIYLRLS
jgi:mannan polymerase complexes MNN9 subunit